MEKKYWYYRFFLESHGGSPGSWDVTDINDSEFFPLTDIKSELEKTYKGRSPVITFWAEISEKAYHKLEEEAKKV